MAIGLVLCAWLPLFADDRSDEPRPLETTMVGIDDAFTTGKGLSELEFTGLHSTGVRHVGDAAAAGEPDHRATYGVAATFTYGITDRLDLTGSVLGLSYVDDAAADDRDAVAGDLVADVKWRLLGDGGSEGLHLAYRPGLSAPTGRDGNGDAPGLGFWTINQTLLATLVERRFVFGFEAGFLVPVGDRGDVHGFGFASAGAAYRARGRVQPELELSYTGDLIAGETDSHVLAATAGAIIRATDSFRVDAGLRYGLWSENATRRVTWTVNLAWSFGGRSP